MHRAVADLAKRRQLARNIDQEIRPAIGRQGMRGSEDGGDLIIAQRDRP
jgi:hypothetical protein